MNTLEVAAGTSAFDFSSLDLSSLVPTLTAAIGATIGITITVIAIRKGIGWLLSSIRRA